MIEQCGIEKAFFADYLTPGKTQGSFLIRRPGREKSFLRSLDFFPSDAFPVETHYHLRFALGLLNARDHYVMRFTTPSVAAWQTFILSQDLFESNGAFLEKAVKLARRCSRDLVYHYGDVQSASTGERALLARLPLGNFQHVLFHDAYPNTLFLSLWLPVDRQLILPETMFTQVEWVPAKFIVETLIKAIEPCEPLTRIVFSQAVEDS